MRRYRGSIIGGLCEIIAAFFFLASITYFISGRGLVPMFAILFVVFYLLSRIL